MVGVNAPLYNALISFVKNSPISFHVPGHKNGMVWNNGEGYFKKLLQMDLTELAGLDDLHSANGVIAEAQSLLANLYGTKKSYFLVNGSTVGNLAMVLAACSPGDRVLVQRNSHKSVMHALYLAKVKPVFMTPIYDMEAGFQTGVKLEVVEEAIRKYPDCKAIILTNPNYYGVTFHLKSVIELAHDHHIPVLIDEAHGAHFCLGSPFPESAISQGADIIIHSAHKTLPAMTMGSYLHFNSEFMDREKVEFYLSVLQSSSPSYPIMASLDLARAYVESLKQNGFEQVLEDHLEFKKGLSEIPEITLVTSTLGGAEIDPLKVIIQGNGNISGFELQSMLERENIYPEMADSKNVIMILPLDFIRDKKEIIRKIKRALQDATMINETLLPQKINMKQESTTEILLTYQEMDECLKEIIDLSASVGEISAEDIIPYPPGIPLIMRGERVKENHIIVIQKLIEQGAVFQGNAYLNQNKMIVFTHRGD